MESGSDLIFWIKFVEFCFYGWVLYKILCGKYWLKIKMGLAGDCSPGKFKIRSAWMKLRMKFILFTKRDENKSP